MTLVTAATAEEWAHATTETFVPLTVGSVANDFRGTIDQRVLTEDVQITAVTAGRSNVRRTTRLARTTPSDDLLFAVHLNGEGAVSQDGRVAGLIPGNGVLYDTARPYELRFPGSSRELILQVPRDQIPLDRRVIEEACARTFPPTDPGLRVLRVYLSEVLDVADSLTAFQRLDYARTAMDLLTAVLRDAGPTQPTGSLLTLQAFIRGNLANPALSPTLVATTHRVSARHVYNLFQEANTTPAAYIRQQRLLSARRELADIRSSHRSVAAIAGRHGFDDATTFTRAFRREFNITPQQCREATKKSLAQSVPVLSL